MYILDNHNILLILENVISIRRMLEQQNDFLIRMENKNDRSTVLAATGGINRNIAEFIIPVRPFKKYNELIAFDEILNTDEEGKKQMVKYFTIMIKFLYNFLNYFLTLFKLFFHFRKHFFIYWGVHPREMK